eukprot:10887529-Karenia_brevis.AAC.1
MFQSGSPERRRCKPTDRQHIKSFPSGSDRMSSSSFLLAPSFQAMDSRARHHASRPSWISLSSKGHS